MKKHIYYFRSKLYLIGKNLIFVNNYNILKKNMKLNKSIRQKVIFNSYSKSIKINKTNIRKFCIFTGRLRSTVHDSKVNRLNFRELVSKGLVPGVFKK